MIIISFILEYILSFYLKYTTIFKPLFVYMNIPFLTRCKKNSILILIIGIFYDVMNDTIFINLLLFLLIYRFSNYLKNKKDNIFYFLIINIVFIIFYKVINYCILSFLNIIKFNINILLTDIYSSFFINIVYTIVLYFIYKKTTGYRIYSKNML